MSTHHLPFLAKRTFPVTIPVSFPSPDDHCHHGKLELPCTQSFLVGQNEILAQSDFSMSLFDITVHSLRIDPFYILKELKFLQNPFLWLHTFSICQICAIGLKDQYQNPHVVL